MLHRWVTTPLAASHLIHCRNFWLCAVRGDLIRILNKLLKRKNRLDAIMIETTGLANPAPVIQTFFVDDEIKDACLLDAVLTVVDAKHITMHLDDEKPDDVVNEAGE
jgi:G3E family GTPase